MAHKEISIVDIEKIQNYMQSFIGGIDSGDVDKFIESHRYLRSLNLENGEIQRNAFKEGFESGRNAGMESITNGMYIEVDKLKAMTVNELVNFLFSE